MTKQSGRAAALTGGLAAALALVGLGSVAVAQARHRTPMMNPAEARARANNHAKASAMITAAQADAIVLKRFPGKLKGKTRLENEDGKMQFSVMVLSGKTLREVMVDSQTGKIASVEVTTAKKEAAEENAKGSKAHPAALKTMPKHAAKGGKAAK